VTSFIFCLLFRKQFTLAPEVAVIVVGGLTVILLIVVGWIDCDPENPAEVLHLHLFSVLFFFLHHAGDFSYYSYSWTVASVGTLFINLDPLLLLLS
jgi:hypothetical protein